MDIHIVDDDRSTLLFYSKIAQRCGFSSASFDSPKNYLHSMGRDGYCPPMMVLSDVDMPGMNGYQLMVEVRKINPNQRFVIASSSPEVDREKTLACLYFKKPVSPGSLKAAFAALSQCHNSGPHPTCMCGDACIPDNRDDFIVSGWRCPNISASDTKKISINGG